MADIVKALQIEQQYLNARLSGNEPFELADAIAVCGYETLDEYFRDKLVYRVSSLAFSFEETTPPLGAKKTMALTARNEAGYIFGDTDSTCVFHGSEDFNEWYCLDNGIDVINYSAKGGNIIITKGDLSVGINIPIPDINAEWVLTNLVAILRRYTADVSVSGNDILVNGKKIAGSAHYQRGDSFGFVIHFSFSDKMDLIRNICLPETISKEPGYIDFMTRDQLREEIRSWLN